MLYQEATGRTPPSITKGAAITPWPSDSFRGMGQRRPFSDIGDEHSYDMRKPSGDLLSQILGLVLVDRTRSISSA